MNFYKFIEELFYPKRAENWSTTRVATTLESESATMIIIKLTYTRKATSKHFSCIQGSYIMSEATEHMNQDGIGKKANNSVL